MGRHVHVYKPVQPLSSPRFGLQFQPSIGCQPTAHRPSQVQPHFLTLYTQPMQAPASTWNLLSMNAITKHKMVRESTLAPSVHPTLAWFIGDVCKSRTNGFFATLRFCQIRAKWRLPKFNLSDMKKYVSLLCCGITNQKLKNLFRPQKKLEFGMALWISFRKYPKSAQT